MNAFALLHKHKSTFSAQWPGLGCGDGSSTVKLRLKVVRSEPTQSGMEEKEEAQAFTHLLHFTNVCALCALCLCMVVEQSLSLGQERETETAEMAVRVAESLVGSGA